MTMNLHLPIGTVELHEGDILLVDRKSVDPKDFAKMSRAVKCPVWAIVVDPQPGMTIHETIRTCRREDLERVLAEMK
jgi:hypothetical protein